MKTSVKNLSTTRVLATISLGKDELGAAEKVALSKLAKTVKAPGFRKGKVPVSVAMKYVDPNLLGQETIDNALSKAVAEAFIENDIQALARPEVEIKKFVAGQELEFTAEVDIVPPVKLGDYKKLGVKAAKISVSAKEVDDIIDRMRSAQGEKKEVARAAKNGDVVTLDFVGKKDDVAFDGGAAKDYELELGSNSFIPGFEEGLVGVKAGDKKELALNFPDSYHVADLAGAEVVFETTIKAVSEKALPELNDEFVAKAGVAEDVKTVQDLKDDIKRELTQQKEREAEETRKDDLVGKLVEISEVEAPQVLIDDQTKSIEQDMQQNLMYQNLTLDNYISAQGFKDEDDWRAKEVTPAAEKRVKAGLVLAELSKELAITPTADEEDAFVSRYKMQYANSPELAKRFDEPEIRRDLLNRLKTELTVEKLVELNK